MKPSPARFASVIAASYGLLVIGGVFIHYLLTGDSGTLWYSLRLPATIIAVLVSGAVAWGLWQEFAWAWWSGLFAVAVQIYRIGEWFLSRLTLGHQLPVTSWLAVFLLVTFLLVLLATSTRASCSK
jgi:hypothetical protein